MILRCVEGYAESHTVMEVVLVVQWTGKCFERPTTICLLVIKLKLVVTHSLLGITDTGL